MKQTTVLTTALLTVIVLFMPFTGCSTTPVGVVYSFAEGGGPSALLDFESGSTGRFFTDSSSVTFIDYNGAALPKPARKTIWKREIAFPAEEPLPLTVRAKYTAPTPMLNIANATMKPLEGLSSGADLGPGAFLLLFYFAVPLTFCALAVVVDLPMALIMNFNKKVAFECPPLEADRPYALRLERKKPRKLQLVDTGADMVMLERTF
jgi:hypothetical protein